MSNHILNLCWPLKMAPAAKAVLIALADRADDDGKCWPSIATLAERTCLHRATVMEALQWLEIAGAIRAEKKQGRSTFYQVTPSHFDSKVLRESRRTTSRAARPVGNENQSGSTTGRAARHVGQDDLTSRAARPDQSGSTTSPVGQHDTIPHEPSIEPSITTRPRGRKCDATMSAGFAEFWDLFPKKVAKPVAASSWVRKRLDVDQALRETVMAALAQQRLLPAWAKDGGRFVPNPATWLNQERWTDELGPVAVNQQSAGAPYAHGSLAAQAASVPQGWWEQAGFDCEEEAANFGCYWTNFAQFRDRRRIAEEAQV